ncbi:hypothetical protein [Kitasatospora aureofaciens]|uniref:hypothetical protein n=1 Tax=Kitasatospora aureofaciens TaxID=1894 RepID=UPI000B157ED0|nr:hypothetical protein [Kitasatospora aureofaciens]
MSTTRRRALGPGAARMLTDTVRAPALHRRGHRPPAKALSRRAGGVRADRRAVAGAAFEDLDEDVLAETAAEAGARRAGE